MYTPPSSPFSIQELFPLEEKLEIVPKKGKLVIGIPKEIERERRVCLSPDAVTAFTANGHQVLIEAGAGLNASFSDEDYIEAGAEITHDTRRVFGCPLLLKVNPPSRKEFEYINPHTILISAIQLKTKTTEYFELYAKKRITALAFEFITDEEGYYPVVRGLSEIAGSASVLIASELLATSNGGSGLMMGNITGVPPLEVLILGAGVVGENAARSAIGLGATVKMFDNSLSKLRNVQRHLGRSIYTSTIQPKNLKKSLMRCDVLIGAVRGRDRSPIIITEDMVQCMKSSSVIIDVSIDMGGCVETSEVTHHDQPVFTKHGVIHYGVPNIPSRYAKTASLSLSNIITPLLLQMAEMGGIEEALRFNKQFRTGLYYYHGRLTSKAISQWFNLEYRDINLLLF